MKWGIGLLALLSILSLGAVAVYDYHHGGLGLFSGNDNTQVQGTEEETASSCCESISSCCVKGASETEADCCEDAKGAQKTVVKPAEVQTTESAEATK